MDKTIVFIGGVPGVGKTSVIECLTKKYPNFEVLDPGDLFHQYNHDKPLLKTKTIELLVTEILKNLQPKVTLINWHYAVYYQQQFIPHISWTYLKKVAGKKNTKFILFFLEASAEDVFHRREKDCLVNKKKRPLELDLIKKEIQKEEEYFKKQLSIFQNLSPYPTRGTRINNHQIETSVNQLLKIIKTYGLNH